MDPQAQARVLLAKQGLAPHRVGEFPHVKSVYLARPKQTLADASGRELGSIEGVDDPADIDAAMRGESGNNMLGAALDKINSRVASSQDDDASALALDELRRNRLSGYGAAPVGREMVRRRLGDYRK